MISRFIALLLLLFHLPLIAQGTYQCLTSAEFYSLRRMRETGTHQQGRLDGFRITLQRLGSDQFYLAADYLSASGKMKGADQRERLLVSRLTDQIFEMRFGYCFTTESIRCAYYVPFIGWGHFTERNVLYPPSPLPVTYTDKFRYSLVGFLSGFLLTPCLEIGLNCKTMFMHSATSTITDDPDFPRVTMLIRNVPYFRVELPLSYHFEEWPLCCFRLAPFYEYRHFGGRVGSPFDFHDTRFDLLGLSVSLIFAY